MPISRRRLVATAGLCWWATVLLPRSAFAAAYPERPIRMVVPFNTGGNVDAVARLISARMSELLGQQVIVDNRTGAGGSLGAGLVARSAPDGYTLLAGSNGPLTVNPFVQARLGYDPLKDFVPIALTGYVSHVIVVSNAVPARTTQDLVALSKQRTLNTGTSGIGSATHLTLERFNAQAEAKLNHVPYRGGGALLPDLMGGSVDSAMLEFSIWLPLPTNGKARILSLAAAPPSALWPGGPTFI